MKMKEKQLNLSQPLWGLALLYVARKASNISSPQGFKQTRGKAFGGIEPGTLGSSVLSVFSQVPRRWTQKQQHFLDLPGPATCKLKREILEKHSSAVLLFRCSLVLWSAHD